MQKKHTQNMHKAKYSRIKIWYDTWKK